MKILFSLRMNNHPTPNRRHTQQFTPHTQTYTTSLNFMIPFINLKAYIHILHARLIVVFAGKAAFCFDCSDNNKVVTWVVGEKMRDQSKLIINLEKQFTKKESKY